MATVGTAGAIRQPPDAAGALGQGISYPLAYDATGRLRLSYGSQSVLEAVRSICMTQLGERPMEPDYGAGAHLLFEPLDEARTALKIADNIYEHEKRVDPQSLRVTTELAEGTGRFSVRVVFMVKGEATPQFLTFPQFAGV